MKTHTPSPDYKGYRFPSEMISHAVWLYFRFSLSFRDVEELLAQRGIIVTYETVPFLCAFYSLKTIDILGSWTHSVCLLA